MSSGTNAATSNFFSGATQDRPAFAATLMVCSLFALAFQDSLVKFASETISLWQFQFLRAVFNLTFLVVLTRVIWGPGAFPRPVRYWAVVLRSCLLVGAMICFFGGVAFLNLANIAAGLYTFPLFVALFSVILLGERVGLQRGSAILAGFIGTLLILRPGTDDFSMVNLLPVGAGIFYAGTVLTTRKYCREESPVTLAYGAAFAFILAGSIGVAAFSFEPLPHLAREWPYLFTGWRALSWQVFAVVVLCSAINLSSNICLAKAYQTAEVSWLAPFDYTYLIFAGFWGFVVWGQVPDGMTIIGMALIAGSGVFVAWRERKLQGPKSGRFKQRWQALAKVLFDPI